MAPSLKYLASAAAFTNFASAFAIDHSSFTTLSPRDDQLPDEAVYLVECNYYSGPNNDLYGTRDYWVYASDDIKFRSSDKRGEATVLSAQATDHQRHDGFTYHMDWTDGTFDYPLGTTFNDNSHPGFSVWGLKPSPSLLPSDSTVDASTFHLLPGYRSIDADSWLGNNKMDCYGENYTLPADILNYGTCIARYACYRVDRSVLRTTLHVYNNVIDVSKCGDYEYFAPTDPPPLPNPSDVFAHVKEAMDKNQGASVGYDIGDTGCKIHFDYITSNAPNDKFADPNLSQRVADLMQQVAAAPVAETRYEYGGGCYDSSLTGLTCKPCNAMKYPKEGYLSREVSDLKSRGSDNGVWVEISNVGFRVECDAQCSGDTGLWSFIKKATTYISAGSNLFAGASGLGAWATILGDAAGPAPSC